MGKCLVWLGGAVCLSSFALEGMWLLEAPPLKLFKTRYGVSLNQSQLEHLQKATLKLANGGTGSFVSPYGLVLTNQHVARDLIQSLASEKNDYVKNGFYARTLGDEIPIPGLEVNRLVSVEDVTERVLAASPSPHPFPSYMARRAMIGEIEAQCQVKSNSRCDVVSLFRGAKYHLYRYEKFSDLRLVFVPENAIAYFGGEEEHFEFPRFNFDIAFLRVYKGGKPYQPDFFFPWTKEGIQEGEPSVAVGHPGETFRHLTSSELEFERDIKIPEMIDLLETVIADLEQYKGRGVEQARQVKGDITRMQNALKVYRGRAGFLLDTPLISGRRRREYEQVEKERASSGRSPSYSALRRISEALSWMRDSSRKYRFVENWYPGKGRPQNGLLGGPTAKLPPLARDLVRYVAEKEKSSQERLSEFRESRLSSVERELFANLPIHLELETFLFAKGIERFRKEFRLEGKTPPLALAREIVGGTKLVDVKERKRLAALSFEQLSKEEDPLIQYILETDPVARKHREFMIEYVFAFLEDGGARISKIALASGTAYSDATFTLRMTLGRVLGYKEGTKDIAPFTHLKNLFEYAKKNAGKKDFKLPESWNNARDSLTNVPFNFTSTHDITAGNSGSPVLSSNLELVGLIFDGNPHSLDWDYKFDDRQGRAISVDARAIVESLDKIYQADRLVQEIGF